MYYRAYFFEPDGDLVRITDIDCPPDQEALEKAQQLANGMDVELCSKGRFLAMARDKQTSETRPDRT
jgi:hypothetical protein